MREPGFEEFADLWDEPDAAEREAFEALARKARRQGRMLAYLDAAMVVFILAGCVLGVAVRPSPLMMVMGAVLLLGTVLVTWRRGSFRQMAQTLSARDRRALLENSISNASADLRRIRLSMLAFPPFVLLALLFKDATRHGGRLDAPLDDLASWVVSVRGLITISIFLLMLVVAAASRRKIKNELRRMTDLQAAYAAELRRDEADAYYP
jgi:hypothetical protein